MNDSTDAKPRKKTKWYWNVLLFVVALVPLCGIEGLLLRDIPLLLFCSAALALLFFPFHWMTSPSKEKRWTRRSLLWLLFGIIWTLGVLAVVHVFVLFVIPPFSISPQTTYLTEPRSKEFYGIDYAAHIERQLDPGVPTEENGFRLLTETFGRTLFSNINDQYWNRVCEYLDLPPEIEPKLTPVDWITYTKTLTPEENEMIKSSFRDGIALPFSDEALPIVGRWLDDNDAALDLFCAAVQKPVLYVPPMFGKTLIDTLLIYDDTCRRMARELNVRIRYRLAVGEIDKAWDDVLAIYRLGEHHRRTVWNQVTSLLNNVIAETANHSAQSVLIHSDWDSNEIRRKAEEIVPFLQPFSDEEITSCLRGERFTVLDIVQRYAEGDFSRGKEEQPNWEDRLKGRSLRLGLMMSRINQRFDEMELRFFNNLPEPDREPHPDMVMVWILKLLVWHGKPRAVSVLIARVMCELLSPTIEAYRTSFTTRQANASLLRLLFALEGYKREHGSYPDTLDDLQEGLIFLDPFSGEAFRYIAEPPGFLLYSVGPNGIDDEGRTSNDLPKGDDIRRRIP